MRIGGGVARGRTVKTPPGGRTRPTSDLVRGAIFSMLAARGADLSCILDLYAGSGALGIEALSRGGEWCDFVERDPRACTTIRENLQATGFADRGAVHCVDAKQLVTRLGGGPYTVVLADPPYADEASGDVVTEVARSPLVAGGAILVWERSSREPRPERVGLFDCIAERRHGDTVILLYARGDVREGSA